MIRWINSYIGTGPHGFIDSDKELEVVDVRDLVDKSGNSIGSIRAKIEKGICALKSGRKVVICCDYGISRSNAVAAGIITQYEAVSFDQAVKMVLHSTGEKSIKIEVLNAVRDAVADNRSAICSNMVLLTGASGFIGEKLKASLSQKMSVLSLDKKTLNLLTDTVELDRTIKKNDVRTLVHLANPRLFSCNYALGETLVMLKNILDVCRENAVRLIYPSCWEVYSGHEAPPILVKEDLERYPRGVAGEAKYFSEQLIELYVKTFGIEAVIFRISPVYGNESLRPRFIYNFINKALQNKPIVTHQYLTGNPVLDLVHVDDVVAAIIIAVQQKDLSGSINIGSGIGYSTYEIAHLIKRFTGSSSSIDVLKIESLFSNIVMDTQKAKKLLSWTASVKFEVWLKSHIAELMKGHISYE